MNTLGRFSLPVQLLRTPVLLVHPSWEPLCSFLRAKPFTTTGSCAIVQPSSLSDESLSFPISQPPSRLTLLFPFSQTHIKVITGGYETVQVKVQEAQGSVTATEGFDIEYDGTHVALVEQSRATKVPAQKLGSRNILATVPERYCHIGIHTAGGIVDVQSVTEASLRVVSCSGAVKLGKIKATSAEIETAGGGIQCQAMTADKAQLKTQGGDISLGRLVGQQCVLDARPADTASGESSTSGSVNVEVAYTESLDIKTGTGPITLGFLDTMNGSASLLSRGGSITVNGLDGSANVQSHGGPIHVKLQENLRHVQALSAGGAIRCTLPPALGAISASIDPISNATFAQDVSFEADPQTSTSGVLHVGSNDNLIARQQSMADRQGQEQQQQGLHHAHAKQVTQPVVRLTLNASKSDSANSLSEGQIHVSTQSWLEQVTAKAKAKMQQQNKAC